MYLFDVKSFVLISVVVFTTTSCLKQEESKVDSEKKENAAVVIEEQTQEKVEPEKTNESATLPSPNIMNPLPGTDPCFEAVELLRDEGDAQMYRNLGQSILLDDNEVAKDSHRTYMGIIGGMLRDKKRIPEIRQKVLDTCRFLKKERKVK